MTIGYIYYSDTMISLCFIDTNNRSIQICVEKESADCVSMLPVLWKKYLRNFKNVIIATDTTRFSRSRQLALSCNLLANEYGNGMYMTQESAQTFAQDPDRLKGISWKKIIMPRYSQRPNITLRKHQ